MAIPFSVGIFFGMLSGFAIASTGEQAVSEICTGQPPVLDWPACAERADCLFTGETLKEFVGTAQETTILLSVVSYVFNVTSAPQHYAKGRGYDRLAGIDASRSLATMSMEVEDIETQRLDNLDEEEWEELFKWIDKYQDKYPLVGRLLDWRPNVTFDEINRFSGFSLRPPPQA